jgi:hypothetical protein
MNACGVYVPHVLIFPWKRINPGLLYGYLSGTFGHTRDKGYTAVEVSCFIWRISSSTRSHLRPLEFSSTWTIHPSHMSIFTNYFCREKGVVTVGIPPHTSHPPSTSWCAFLRAIKKSHNEGCINFMASNSSTETTERQIGIMFCKGYLKSATVRNAVNWFRATGIAPLDSRVFSEVAFLPVATTAREIQPELQETGQAMKSPPTYGESVLQDNRIEPRPKTSNT